MRRSIWPTGSPPSRTPFPEAVGRITVAPTELPFPSAIAHERIAELGDVPVTPYREAIAETAEIYGRLAGEGRLVASEQGVPAGGDRRQLIDGHEQT